MSFCYSNCVFAFPDFNTCKIYYFKLYSIQCSILLFLFPYNRHSVGICYTISLLSPVPTR